MPHDLSITENMKYSSYNPLSMSIITNTVSNFTAFQDLISAPESSYYNDLIGNTIYNNYLYAQDDSPFIFSYANQIAHVTGVVNLTDNAFFNMDLYAYSNGIELTNSINNADLYYFNYDLFPVNNTISATVPSSLDEFNEATFNESIDTSYLSPIPIAFGMNIMNKQITI